MRFLHRIYAALFGYFWLPCPVCSKNFGGHEVSIGRPPLVIEQMGGGQRARSVCSMKCGLEAQRRNDSNGNHWPIRILDKHPESGNTNE